MLRSKHQIFRIKRGAARVECCEIENENVNDLSNYERVREWGRGVNNRSVYTENLKMQAERLLPLKDPIRREKAS